MANNIFELDFTGIESSNLIPEGTHTVVVSDAVFSKASTGSDQLQITFKTADGAVRSSWYNLQPQALWKLKGFLETIGIPCEGKIKLNTKALIGKTCQISVEKDPNDMTKLIITRTAKLESVQPTVAYNPAQFAAPAQAMPAAPANPAPTVAPQPPVQTPVQAAPQAPQAPVFPQQPAVAPVQQAAQPVQGNLPFWMQQAQQQASAAPTNLPPWAQQQK